MSHSKTIGGVCRSALRNYKILAPIAFLIVYGALVIITKPQLFFGGFVLPAGDFAGDDLLIYKAKSFHLLYGNYSRVGFNHPGPFFLQVAAFGETVFYDILKVFPSYYAAQTFSLSLLIGFSLTMAFRLWLLITRDLLASLTAVLAMIATISVSWDQNIFVIMWNPHSYVAGAGMLAAGLMGIWARNLRWAPLAAVGSVSLIHGHASFLGLVPLILCVFAAELAFRHRARLIADPGVVWRQVVEHWVSVAITLAILALGALPIALNWPGDFPAYFRFAHAAQPHPIPAAVKYVLQDVPLAGIWLLAFLLRRPPERAGAPPEADVGKTAATLRSASLAVFVSGLVGAIFYAWRGVDSLDYRYLILWTTPFIGVAVGSALIYFMWQLDRQVWRLLIVAIAAVTCWASLRHKILGFVVPQETASIERAAQQIRQMAPAGEKIAVSIDLQSPSAGQIWTEAVPVAALLQRQGSHAFCVRNGWHILFTRAYQCAPGDKIARSLELMTPSENPKGIPIISFYGFNAYDPKLSLGAEILPHDFSRSGIELGQNWSAVENMDPQHEWIWSDGASPTLLVNTEGLPRRALVQLRGILFSDNVHPQTVSLLDDAGHPIDAVTGLGGVVTLSGVFDRPKPTSIGQLTIRLKVAHPVSPKSFGMNADTRNLGFGLQGMTVTAAP